MDNHSNEESWQKRYSEIAKAPHLWLIYATQLLDAANRVLVKETDGPMEGLLRNVGIHMMLAAFAVEDIFKAIILAKDPKIISDKSKRSKLFSGHNLCRLASQANITCTTDELNLLKLLSKSITCGRYPIPKDWVQYNDGSGHAPRSYFSVPYDYKLIVGLVHKLETELQHLGIHRDMFDQSYVYYSDSKDRTQINVKRQITPYPYNFVDEDTYKKK